MAMLVVHSPLVGPATTRPLAAALRARGRSAHAPDLRRHATSPASFGEGLHAALADVAPEPVEVVIGHSGAGPFLPALADAPVPGGGLATIVYLDAVVPEDGPVFRPSPGLLEILDRLPIEDGRLPPWPAWWPPEVFADLVPDPSTRAQIAAESPHLPRSFYDASIPLPARWVTTPSAYIQLSPAYDVDRQRAVALSWPTIVHSGGHLDLATRPDLVADLVLAVLSSATS